MTTTSKVPPTWPSEEHARTPNSVATKPGQWQSAAARECNLMLPGGSKKNPGRISNRGFELKPGSVLLSHGETPHYHRRCTVSLLSSGWDQVVPVLYCRQANCCVHCARSGQAFGLIDQALGIVFALPKDLGRYMVKPHGQLVLVSFIHYCTSTPSLSTL